MFLPNSLTSHNTLKSYSGSSYTIEISKAYKSVLPSPSREPGVNKHVPVHQCTLESLGSMLMRTKKDF